MLLRQKTKTKKNEEAISTIPTTTRRNSEGCLSFFPLVRAKMFVLQDEQTFWRRRRCTIIYYYIYRRTPSQQTSKGSLSTGGTSWVATLPLEAQPRTIAKIDSRIRRICSGWLFSWWQCPFQQPCLRRLCHGLPFPRRSLVQNAVLFAMASRFGREHVVGLCTSYGGTSIECVSW